MVWCVCLFYQCTCNHVINADKGTCARHICHSLALPVLLAFLPTILTCAWERTSLAGHNGSLPCFHSVAQVSIQYNRRDVYNYVIVDRMARIQEARRSVPPVSLPTHGAPVSQARAISEGLRAFQSHASSIPNQPTANERPLLEDPPNNDDTTAGQRLQSHPAEGIAAEIFPVAGSSDADRQTSEDEVNTFNVSPDTVTVSHQTPNDEDRGGCMNEGGGSGDGDNITDALEIDQNDCDGLTESHQRRHINESGALVLVSRQAPNDKDLSRNTHGGDGPEDRDDTEDASLDVYVSRRRGFSDTDFLEMDQDARGGLSEQMDQDARGGLSEQMDQDARGGLSEQMDEGNEPNDGDEWLGFSGDEEHAELMDEHSGDAQMNVEGNECDKDVEKSVEERGIEDLVRHAYFIALQLLTMLDVGDDRNGGVD
jgi:hypothetical protein